MFSGSQDSQGGGLAISLKLVSGETIKGKLTAGMTGKLADTINKEEPFVEVQRADGTMVMIAKNVIAQIEKIETPKTDQLDKRLSNQGILDPYTVLGVNRNANKLDVQAAYHTLARRYHPDHFSGREIHPKSCSTFRPCSSGSPWPTTT